MFSLNLTNEDTSMHAISSCGGAWYVTISTIETGICGIPTHRSTTHAGVDLSTVAALQAVMLLGGAAPWDMWELCESFYAANPEAVRVIP